MTRKRTPSRTQRVKASQKARTEVLIGRLVAHMDQDAAQAQAGQRAAVARAGARTGSHVVGVLGFLAVASALALATSVALDVFR